MMLRQALIEVKEILGTRRSVYPVNVRVLLIAMFVLSGLTVGSSYPVPGNQRALAQDSEADVVATIEALETQVAEQGDRITQLEENFVALERVVGQLISGDAADDDSAASVSSGNHLVNGMLVIEPHSFDETILDANFFGEKDEGAHCTGANAFDDVTGEMDVLVTDGADDTIAIGQTESGEYHFRPITGCQFMFTIDLPETDFYTIQIGRRQGPTYSRAEMEEMNWQMVLSIG